MSPWMSCLLGGINLVKHVLRDGTCLDDITGHVVKMDDVGEFYSILGRMQKGISYESNLDEENTCNLA